MIRHGWLIGGLALGAALMGCGDDSEEPSGGVSAQRRVVAEALTAGIDIEHGTVRLQELPLTTEENLLIEQDDEPVSLEPGTVSLLPFTIDNPDEEDPVVAVLLSFEDNPDEHIEVEIDTSDAGNDVELMLNVDSDVCENVCAQSFTLTLLQKLKLDSGGIGKIARKLMMLDCSNDGDPDMCEDKGGDGDGDGDTTGDGDGDGDTTGDGDGDGDGMGSTTTASQFNNQVSMLNRALCDCDPTMAGAHCDADWLDAEEQMCARTAIETDAASSNVSMLATGIANLLRGDVCSIGAAGVFEAALPNEANRTLPPSLLACSDTAFAASSAGNLDAGAAP